METDVTKQKLSRYTQGGQTFKTINNEIKWWQRSKIEKNDDDLIIEIIPRFHTRPDRMAYELYGKSELAWIILQFNTILDINTEFITGKFINVPHPNRVIFNILNKSIGGIIE